MLPIEGRDLLSQPLYVYQTITTCEHELEKIEKELASKPPSKET